MSRVSIFFSQGFRPFFLFAGLLAATAVPLWLYSYLTGNSIGIEDSYRWHRHEMLFGYFSAALAGFILTALPNWTGRPRISPRALAALAVLWLIGRASFFVPGSEVVQIVLLPAFMLSLAAYVARQVIASGNMRNLVVAVLIGTMGLADVIFLSVDAELGLRLGFAAAAMMIGLIGGRVTPAFTRNWLKSRGKTSLPPPSGRFDMAVMIFTLLAALTWVIWPNFGAGLLLAGILHLIRLSRWRGFNASEPLILMLHLAYLWLPLGLIILGLNGIFPTQVPLSSGFHALGAGAVALMTLIVMMRAILGHSGQALRADFWLVAGFALVSFGAILRVTAALLQNPETLLIGAASLWASGFLLFVLRFFAVFFLVRKK